MVSVFECFLILYYMYELLIGLEDTEIWSSLVIIWDNFGGASVSYIISYGIHRLTCIVTVF